MKKILFTASQVVVAAFLTLAVAKCSLVQADEIYDWSGTAANNNAAPPDGFPENMNYSEVNDAARELMAVVKRYVEATDGTNTTGGTQPAYTLTSGQSLSTPAAGRVHVWTAHATSTGNVTLNVDAAGAKNVVDAFGTQLGSGALVQNGIYMTVEEGTDHRIIGTFSTPPVSGPASSTDNAVARFNGTDGTTVQNSSVLIDDSNNVSGVVALTTSGGIELGHASDTTLARASAGVVNIEGNVIYRAGGTDVPVTDGGTGASTAANARTNLGVAIGSDVQAFDAELADVAATTPTKGNLLAGNGSAWISLGIGSANQVLTVDSAEATGMEWRTASPIVPATVQATTSGTAFDFTGIPAGVNRITVMFDSVSLSGSDDLHVQIGDSGGVESTGYQSYTTDRSSNDSDTSAFEVGTLSSTGDVDMSGHMLLTRVTGNVWVESHTVSYRTDGVSSYGGGRKALSAELDRVRITRSGFNTFDNGQVNIFYE